MVRRRPAVRLSGAPASRLRLALSRKLASILPVQPPLSASPQVRTAPIRFLVASSVSARRKVSGIEPVIFALALDPVADRAELEIRGAGG